MAVVTLSEQMRSGLRLRDFFTAVDGKIVFDQSTSSQTATFKVDVDHIPVDVLYGGPRISASSGEVAYLEFKVGGQSWLRYGSAGGPALFHYSDLSMFHAQGGLSAAFVMSGTDQVLGSSHGDYLEGYGGNDLMNGGLGADTLDGGAGDDTYIVDQEDDRILEASGGGYDVVYTTVRFALASDSEIEVLKGADGASSLSLFGNDLPNLIVGTAGNDQLDGKGGGDVLIGGAGDDAYGIDNPSDVAVEDNGQGYDTVVTWITFALGANVEVLKAAGGDLPVGLTGNALPNEIFGNSGANPISGLDGDDRLYGDGGADRILGGAGQDDLFGGIGNDVLSGGDGNDSLYGDTGKDTIDGGAGHDLLFGGTGSNKLLGQSGADTLYGGMHTDVLQGGSGNDRLYGDVGNDSLDGGAGNDVLSGGWGRDTFIFRYALNARTNVDRITDFNVKDDSLRLENSVFKKLGKAGKLKSDFFVIGSKAQDGNDHLIYNKKSGYLSYDPDGSGAKAAILFLKLKTGLALTDKDFYVI